MKFYHEDHQWVEAVNGAFYIGLSFFGADELGEVNFVELPKIGSLLAAGEVLGVVESVKAASDLLSPIGGQVVAVNELLQQQPSLLNQDPEGRGWLCQLQEVPAEDLEKLMTEEQYQKYLQTAGGENP